ncbi:hypothetical protein BDV98DRAFT_567747 [Pterulicium gracile]|uniref:Uncharacterized protein n=1 Tax=Pterulicium gracile TaxID=1884261 RepID=A0A5C3QL78_9AGAR|nr:hypothetical protein BDV98DRAFT_567747 [Pterula gracilis]
MPDTKPAMQPNRSAADAVPLTLPQFTKADYSSFFLAGALCCTYVVLLLFLILHFSR